MMNFDNCNTTKYNNHANFNFHQTEKKTEYSTAQ